MRQRDEMVYMDMRKIIEGGIKLQVPVGYKLDSKMPVFYNPIQIINRDISILLLSSIKRYSNEPLRVLDLLSASGVRGLRIKKEIPNCEVTLNDYKEAAFELMKKNASLNKLKVTVRNKPANVLLGELQSYDYIDVDPFGTPVPFLNDAIKRLAPHAVLAVTATDTSSLCGTYPRVCLRRYNSRSFRNEFMHETAVRILIKKCQEVAAQYDVALVPIFVHSSDHYVRVYLRKFSSKRKVNFLFQKTGWILYCEKCCWRKTTSNLLSEKNQCPNCKSDIKTIGSMWLGGLWDTKLVQKMVGQSKKSTVSEKTVLLLNRISEEMAIKTVGFYDLHLLAKRNKWTNIPKLDKFLEEGVSVRTHFRDTGIRSKKDLFIE